MNERAHAILSASGADRWTRCPPSARWEDVLPDKESPYSEEGTRAHELLEIQLLKEFKHKEVQTELETTKEMEAVVREAVDFIKTIALGYSHEPYVAIERRVDFSHIAQEGFGTADCIIISGSTMHVIDFKYGKGVPVYSENNLQMMLYALGALMELGFLYPIHFRRCPPPVRRRRSATV